MLNVRYFSVVSLGTVMSTFRLFEEFVIVGDNVSLKISTSYAVMVSFIDSRTVILSPTITNSSNNLNVDITVPNDTTEKYLTFNITVQNEYDVKLSAVPSNLSTASIFVDTIPPNITLNGNATYSVLVNSSYTDPGAVSSDGDPNYAKTYVITNTSILNTTLVGSTVIYTYTADSDGAGNLGANITRNVTVPPPPIEIAIHSFAISAISAVNINTPEDTDIIMINGSYYAITVNSYGMPITNITNPAFPIRVSHVPLSNLIQVETITIENSHYALAVKHDSVTIINITNPTSPFVISEIPSETINGSLLSINTIGTLTINNTNHYSIISLASPEVMIMWLIIM